MLSYIGIAQDEGASLALGGQKATRAECGRGWFIEPTIIPFDDEEEAVAIANDVRFRRSGFGS